jgi:uncharacterized protein YkwD
MRTLIRIVVLAACTSALVPGVAAAQSCPGPAAGGDPSAARAAILCLLNEQRKARGLAALREQGQLRTAAKRYAARMVREHFFSHERQGMIRRVRRTGYLRGFRRWKVGENLAWGAGAAAGPQEIVTAWMASPPHRRNILTRGFRSIGIGLAAGAPVAGSDGMTFVTEFGVRRR